jgi:hypothetical protein
MNVDTYNEENEQNHQEKLTNLYSIANYFNQLSIKIEKKNIRRILSYKKTKNLNRHNTMIQSKYEKMLKRLLAQKEIENKGPKRRDTIRHNNNKEFSKLIQEVIEENKDNKHKNKKDDKNKNNNNKLQKKESILINYKDKKNILSLTYGKQSVIITNKMNHKKITDTLGDVDANNEIKPTCGDIKNNNNDL